MIDLVPYREPLLLFSLIILVVVGVGVFLVSWFRSVKGSFRVLDGWVIISFDQTGRQVLNQLKALQSSSDFKDHYHGVRFRERVYHEDELGNEVVDYYKEFSLSKDILLKINLDRLLQKHKGDYNEVIVYIATELSELTLID